VIVSLHYRLWPSFGNAFTSRPISANQTSSGGRDNTRLGFARRPATSDADAAADGCAPGAAIVNDLDDPDMDKRLAARIRTAKERFLGALNQSSDRREQALGLMLQHFEATRPPHRDGSAALDALARLAADSADPAVYEMALLTCGKAQTRSGVSGCDGISATRWTEIDPDNAVSWLTSASEAKQLNDTVNEALDLHRAAASQRFDNYSTSLLAMAQPAMPKDLTRLEEYYLDVDVIGVASAMVLPYGRAIQDCQAASGSDGDSNDCDRIAERMVADGRTMIDLAIASHLGEKAGWPAQRLSDLKRERAALTMVALGIPRDFTTPQSCHDAVRDIQRAKRWSAVGELPALRAEFALSGLSAEDLEVQYDQWTANINAKVW